MIAAGACAGGAEEATGDRRDQIQAQPATTVPWSVFCADATGFVDFLDAEYAALFDPATAEGFMVATDGRLADLEVQAPEEVSGEVRALREAYSELSRLLAEVSYDVAKVDGDALIALIESEASLDFDNYLTAECGRGLAPVEGRGPQVLSDAELDELLGVDPADGSVDDVDAFLAGLLAEGSGIDRAAADCAVAGLDDDIKEALIAGGSTAETSGDEVRAALAVSLESCGVDPLDSSGEP
ncbi:MAG: hypothetical protein O3C27_12570 [Actinomycetota bacterium]|nr:hypothetical protein [Actinomycetota bacterium]